MPLAPVDDPPETFETRRWHYETLRNARAPFWRTLAALQEAYGLLMPVGLDLEPGDAVRVRCANDPRTFTVQPYTGRWYYGADDPIKPPPPADADIKTYAGVHQSETGPCNPQSTQ